MKFKKNVKKNICLFVTLVFMIFITSCENTNNQDHTHEFVDGICECGEKDPNYELDDSIKVQAAYEKIINDLPTYMYLGDKLNLKNKVDDFDISYSLENNKYISEDFVVTNVEQTRHRITTLFIKIDTYTFKHEIIIHQDINAYFEKVFDYIDDVIPTGNSDDDINFITEYPSDKNLVITYKSNKPEFVTNEGLRIDHKFDEDVIITCTLSKDGKTISKDYQFESRGIPYNERYQITLDYLDEFFENNVLEEGCKLPTTHPLYGGRIRWICEDPTLIYDYETLHLPKEAKNTHLLAEIKFGSSEYHLLSYPVTLDARPNTITDEVYAKTFLETVLKDFDNYLVLYDGTKANINTDYLVDEEKMQVNYKMYTDVVRPEVPQDVLDRLLYEGYKMPNPENVLWITVHETGMSYAGKDALLLANLQKNTAIDGGREASWGYTVDDHSIYQSFPDTYRLWHATDGRTIGGGNSNGIGIEMCVNSDGQYDLSMRNNARLMAGLLEKYGLGMMNMKRHYDFYDTKSCPEIMIKTWRWYEYLTMIEREYISQTILSGLNISYEIDAIETKVDGVYDLSSLESNDTIDIKVMINDLNFTITAKKN